MRSRSQGRRRSVDRGTCGPDIQPRKFLPPGRRRCRRKRKAPSGAPISRGVPESRAVRDPVHVRRHLAWEPGDPKSAHSCCCPGTHREVQGRTPIMNGHGKSDRPVVPVGPHAAPHHSLAASAFRLSSLSPAPHGRHRLRMRESRLSGSVEGVVCKHDPYSDSSA
jgi:hypothetical protein